MHESRADPNFYRWSVANYFLVSVALADRPISLPCTIGPNAIKAIALVIPADSATTIFDSAYLGTLWLGGL